MELVSAWSMHTNIKRQSWERIVCSDLGPALASLLSNIFATTQERWKSTPGQRLKATSIRVYKMRIEERRHRNTNPPWSGADWQQQFFQEQTGWSCRSAGSRWVAYNSRCLEKSRDLYICCHTFVQFVSDLTWVPRHSSPGLKLAGSPSHRVGSVTSARVTFIGCQTERRLSRGPERTSVDKSGFFTGSFARVSLTLHWAQTAGVLYVPQQSRSTMLSCERAKPLYATDVMSSFCYSPHPISSHLSSPVLSHLPPST